MRAFDEVLAALNGVLGLACLRMGVEDLCRGEMFEGTIKVAYGLAGIGIMAIVVAMHELLP